jgi:predicted patatin/cPLA2 family phospholipase
MATLIIKHAISEAVQSAAADRWLRCGSAIPSLINVVDILGRFWYNGGVNESGEFHMITARNENAQITGTIVTAKDSHGNAIHTVLSSHTKAYGEFLTLSAATHWLWIVDAVVRSRAMRLSR